MPDDTERPVAPPAGGAGQTLADKVDWLFRHMWPPEAEQPKNHIEAAAAIQRVTGEEISSTTVWKLRTGRGENPQFKTLKALAAFFGVPIGYFGDGQEAETVADQLALLALLRDSGIDGAALRALVNLSEDGRQMITEFLASAARLEQRRQAREAGDQGS